MGAMFPIFFTLPSSRHVLKGKGAVIAMNDLLGSVAPPAAKLSVCQDVRLLGTHSSAQLFSGSFCFSQVFYDSLPCISQLHPLKDQRDPRQILHRGFSTLAPGLADPCPPPCDEPAPCKPTRLSGSSGLPVSCREIQLSRSKL